MTSPRSHSEKVTEARCRSLGSVLEAPSFSGSGSRARCSAKSYFGFKSKASLLPASKENKKMRHMKGFKRLRKKILSYNRGKNLILVNPPLKWLVLQPKPMEKQLSPGRPAPSRGAPRPVSVRPAAAFPAFSLGAFLLPAPPNGNCRRECPVCPRDFPLSAVDESRWTGNSGGLVAAGSLGTRGLVSST